MSSSPTSDFLSITDPVEQHERWQGLLARQQELESLSVSLGIDRFSRRVETGQQSMVGAGKGLVLSAVFGPKGGDGIGPVVKAIEFFVADAAKQRGIKHCALSLIEKAGVEVCAYLSVKVLVDRITERTPLRIIAAEVAQLIIDDVKFRRMSEMAPKLFEYRLSKFKTAHYAHMARVLNHTANQFACKDCIDAAMASGEYVRWKDVPHCEHMAMADIDYPPSQKVLMGTKFIDLVIQATSLVTTESERTRVGRRVKDELYVIATPETLDWMAKRNDLMSLLTPMALPMVVPPLQWEPGVRGGYRYNLRGKHALIRGIRGAGGDAEGESMPIVYQAINAIQNTAWKVNTKVWEVVEAIYQEQQGGLAGVPSFNEQAHPARPEDIDTNKDALRQWKKEEKAWHEKDIMRKNRCLEFLRFRNAVLRVAQESAIFFPHNLDFRGRIYPISTFLSPQGDDFSKGVLTFAEGKPLGEDGAAWLAVHGANCYDKLPEGAKASQMTLQERVDWVLRHSEDIVGCAKDPMGNQWWASAEEPLQFLAFCFEWLGYVEQGNDYVCSLPVAHDGSCNGLQHFSAMFRDEVGGAAVNLIPQARPQDIYQRVADKVLSKLEADDSLFAQLWLTSGLVSRSLTKRNVMTYGYGSKEYGFGRQLYEHLKKLDDEALTDTIKRHFTETDPDSGRETDHRTDACQYMAQLIMRAISETVQKAGQAMEWLQRCARQAIRTGQPVRWTVPITCFPVRQDYYHSEQKRITTVLSGRVVRPSVFLPTTELEIHRQVNAIAPNVVHSLDAAALMLTVVAAQNDGVESFGMVHDSYATVPGDVSIMAQATRGSFIQLYTERDVVGDLYVQFVQQAADPERVPEPPSMGTLDVSQVMASEYFFC